MSEQRVLVTGGSGFIGAHLVSWLIRERTELLNLDVSPPQSVEHKAHWSRTDVLEARHVSGAFSDFMPTHVVHLAARTDIDWSARIEDYASNTIGTQNVLDAISATRSVKRSIITSTQFVCRPGYIPKNDEDFDPHTVYGQSKIAAERLTREAELPSEWTIIRPTTIWGPGDLAYRATFYKLMANRLYVHPADRPARRSYGYVGNVVHQIVTILELPAPQVSGRVLYVGDAEIDILDYVNAYSMRMTRRPARTIPAAFVAGLSRVGDLTEKLGVRFPITTARYESMTQDYPVPIEPTLALTDPQPFTLEQGVDQVVQWLKAEGIV